MAQEDKIYIADEGTVFEIEIQESGVALDVSGATDMKIKFQKPDDAETVMTKDATFTTDGTDGLIRYVTLAADLDVEGDWVIQGWVRLPSGAWHTTEGGFTVYTPLGG